MIMMKESPHVAIVSMPWASVWVPSIQLAVLRQCLEGHATVSSYDFYVDFAALISPRLYKALSESLGFAEEWIFASRYFPEEGFNYEAHYPDLPFPPIGIGSPSREAALLNALAEIAEEYLDRLAMDHPWDTYDVVAFSLTISQTAASMAMARRIKQRNPDAYIIFGGTSCAGPPAEAMLRICPYIDVVVRGEAEGCFADLVRRLTTNTPLDDLAGVTFRTSGGIRSTTPGALRRFERRSQDANFDSYFERLKHHGLNGSDQIMLPFESSRGCWWGEKSQCTFCGLHENMQYRIRDAGEVIAELKRLHNRYGVRRFFATDLIMPQSYYKTFLPRLAEEKIGYEFYYELKGNITKAQMNLLKAAGVRLVQPGLESLSTAILKLIRKGTNAAQNVEFLKWAKEADIEVSWNIIVGVPGENPEENESAARRIKALWHLPPPFIVEFELTRFSPAFTNPAEFGISKIAPVGLYYAVFPISSSLLSDLVYRFEYESESFGGRPPWMNPGADQYCPSLHQAVQAWREAYAAGAFLELVPDSDNSGSRIICGHQTGQIHRTLLLSAEETALYQFIDSSRPITAVVPGFQSRFPLEAASLGGLKGIAACLERWEEQSVVFSEGGRVVAIATARSFDNRNISIGSVEEELIHLKRP